VLAVNYQLEQHAWRMQRSSVAAQRREPEEKRTFVDDVPRRRGPYLLRIRLFAFGDCPCHDPIFLAELLPEATLKAAHVHCGGGNSGSNVWRRLR